MDPSLKNRTITRLKEEVPTLSPRLRTVAKYIVDHPSDFGLDPIRETARKAGVSTYSLVRLAEHLGFPSYDVFREPFREALVSATAAVARPDWLESLQDKGDLGRAQAEASANAMAIVQRSLEHQDPDKMQRIVDLLLGAPTVYLTAVRASYALAYYFHYVGRMALPSLQLVPRHTNSAVDDLNYAASEDVLFAITFAPCSRETIEACQFANAKGMKIILFSDSDIILPDFESDEQIVVSHHSTHHFGCYSGAMAAIECLIALLVARGGADARARIASYDTLRERTDAYWAAPKKH